MFHLLLRGYKLLFLSLSLKMHIDCTLQTLHHHDRRHIDFKVHTANRAAVVCNRRRLELHIEVHCKNCNMISPRNTARASFGKLARTLPSAAIPLLDPVQVQNKLTEGLKNSGRSAVVYAVYVLQVFNAFSRATFGK
jgi:hypothetical protein